MALTLYTFKVDGEEHFRHGTIGAVLDLIEQFGPDEAAYEIYPYNPFQVGDYAEHKTRDLDAREVAAVEGPYLRLQIGDLVTEPVLAAYYERIPKEI